MSQHYPHPSGRHGRSAPGPGAQPQPGGPDAEATAFLPPVPPGPGGYPAGADAEATAFLPPVPPGPPGPGGYPQHQPYPGPTPRQDGFPHDPFAGAPYPQAPYEQAPYEQAAYEQAGYEQAPYGQSGYAPTGYEQAPYEQAPYEQAGYAHSPYPQAPYAQAPYGGPQHPGAEYPQDPHAGTPYGAPGHPDAGQAAPAPAYGQQPHQSEPGWQQPQAAAAAEETAILPPYPLGAPDALADPASDGGIPGWDAPPLPHPDQQHPQPQHPQQPQPSQAATGWSGAPPVEESFIGVQGWTDAPMTYGRPLAEPSPVPPAPAPGSAPGGGPSLRESLANAVPTGPTGRPAPVGPPPAHGQPTPPPAAPVPPVDGMSLRDAFAAAAPTGPAGPLAAPTPAAAAGAPPAPAPLAGDDRMSLRDAFAAAAPTGPTPPPAPAHLAHPAAPTGQPGGPGRPSPSSAAATPAAVQRPGVRRNPNAGRPGNPIIDPGIQPAALTLALAVLVALGSLAGRPGLLVPVALLQAVTAAGVFRLNGMWPARQGIALAALGGFVADLALVTGLGTPAQAIGGALGLFLLLVLVLQTFRPSDPDDRFSALSVSATATAFTVLATGLLAVPHHDDALAGALAAGAATVVSAVLARPAKAGFAAGPLVALAVGAGVGAATGLGAGGGAALGLAAGVCAVIGRRVAAYDFPSRFVHFTAGVALPLALSAPAVYLVGHALGH